MVCQVPRLKLLKLFRLHLKKPALNSSAHPKVGQESDGKPSFCETNLIFIIKFNELVFF